MPHPLSGTLTNWRLYAADRELRTALDTVMDTMYATAKARARRPKRWLDGQTLITASRLDTFVRTYKPLLSRSGQPMISTDQCIKAIMARDQVKSFVGNTEHFYGLRPTYDEQRRCIILVRPNPVSPTVG